MSTYQTLIVGTDGSQTSLCAVYRAGEIAAERKAGLIIATGHPSRSSAARRSSAISREASAWATAAGAKDVETKPIPGAPAAALVDLAGRSRQIC
ncbi:Universal stress protein [Mycobacterium pseudokansasii]|uniref:Universal stress protein n=1 Tax=Mycobacterium pseudokansasii TaxID=2341080 RepID=A0A498QMW2_9MYCO|nr:Universal stress protein [Mycobacterium pseudokansasii]VAZ92612.1 Universal stress protein [Mycobacterium pseudokansasii]VBA48787.1 Universal stress protein [Mycobacterium pseudokansasii]